MINTKYSRFIPYGIDKILIFDGPDTGNRLTNDDSGQLSVIALNDQNL
jgi:hypothetical protein